MRITSERRLCSGLKSVLVRASSLVSEPAQPNSLLVVNPSNPGRSAMANVQSTSNGPFYLSTQRKGDPRTGTSPGARAIETYWRPPILSAAPDALALLQALGRRWLLAATLSIGCALLAGALVWHFLPPSKYVARVMLHVASTPPNIIFETKEIRSNFDIYKQTQLRLLKSRSVLESVVDKPHVKHLRPIVEATKQGGPITWLERELQADYTGEILNISIIGSRPEGLAALVNAVADSYIKEVVNVESVERRRRYERLKGIYEEYQAKLKQKHEVLDELARRIGSADKSNVRLAHALVLENQAMMQRELMRLKMERRAAESELAILKREPVPNRLRLSGIEAAEYIEHDEHVAMYTARIAKLKAIAAAATSRVRNHSDPSVQRPLQELAQQNALLAARREELRAKVARMTSEPIATEDANLAELDRRIKTIKELEHLTETEVNGLSNEAGSINENSIHLEDIQSDIIITDAAAKRVGSEVEALNIELDAPSRVRLIEAAKTPQLTGNNRGKLVGIVSGGAMILALAGISFHEFRSRRVSKTEEVHHGLGIRLVGTIPSWPKEKASLGGASHSKHYSPYITSIDSLRTNLLNLPIAEPLSSILVTSAVASEGKSTLASHLATSLARAGKGTLLVDGDLRRADIHRLFDLPLEPGLGEILRGEIEPDLAPRPTALTNLWVLTAGRSDEHAIQALAHEDLSALFRRFKQRFDIIVIDACPVLPVGDAVLLGRQVDAVIYSVLQGVSTLPKVHAAHERLKSLGIPVVGAVVSGVAIERYESRDALPDRRSMARNS